MHLLLLSLTLVPLLWAWTVCGLPAEQEAEPRFVRFPLKRTAHPAVERRQDTVSLPFTNVFAFLIQVKIGTPGVNFELMPDTTSTDTWVNPTCANTIFSDPSLCPRGVYKPSSSSTSASTGTAMNWQHVYGDWSGSASGIYYKDTVAIGSVSLTSAQFGVASVSTASSSSSYGLPFGFLGLAFGGSYPNIIDNFKLQGKTNSRLFGLGMGAGSPAGEIVFGGIDTKKYAGALSAIPIVFPGPDGSKRYWVTVTALGKTISGVRSASPVTATIALDSATLYSYLPSSLMSILTSSIYPGGSFSGNSYSVPCSLANQAGTIDFVFNGVAVSIPYKSFIFNHAGSCFLAAQTVTSGQVPVLGSAFMGAVYSVFDQDYRTVYLAPFVDCGSSVLAVPNAAGAPLQSQFLGKCGNVITTPTPTKSFFTVPTNCRTNRCLGAMSNPAKITRASSFCNSFLRTSVPAQSTNVVPTYLGSVCSSSSQISSVSSGCQCFLAQYTGPPL